MSLAAAARELAEETDVHVPTDSLRPIGVWDAPDRGPRGRYITVAYMVVVPVGTAIIAGDDVRTGRWWPLDRLPERLAFDHAAILNGGGGINALSTARTHDSAALALSGQGVAPEFGRIAYQRARESRP